MVGRKLNAAGEPDRQRKSVHPPPSAGDAAESCRFFPDGRLFRRRPICSPPRQNIRLPKTNGFCLEQKILIPLNPPSITLRRQRK
ncbi:MAG: hypothetical protein BAA03_10410 [Caldibacillus debilis]|nr:MAG: hypothetical protein BAA03_10410 [Caldibacillus debilis]